MNRRTNQHVQEKVLVLLIVVASLVRIFVCLQHNPMDYLSSDPWRHWQNGIQFPGGGYLAAADPIGYQVYVHILRSITGDNRILVALLSGLLSVVMPWTYYRAARTFGMKKIPALWVWLLIAWTPSLFTIYHYIMMETLLLVIDGVALWMTARYLRKGGTGPFLDSVFVWTLACLTKPTVLPLAGICVLWSCWKRATPWRDIAIATAVALALLVPQAIRSKKELGFVAPFGNPWLTKIQHRSGVRTIYVHFHGPSHEDDVYFTSPSCYVRPLWPLSLWAIRRALDNSSLTISVESTHGDRDWKNAYESLDVGWGEWLAQWRENVMLFLFAPSWPEVTSPGWDGRLEGYTRWLWMPLMIFILGCNLRAFLRRRVELIPVAVTLLLLFLALQNVATTEGRYRKPLEPLLMLNLVWGLSSRYGSETQSDGSSQELPPGNRALQGLGN